MVDPGDHRIGDAERQQAIDLLRTHTGAGRLTLDEFGDLAAQVYAAQTYRELEAVARNLPPGLVPDPSAAPAGPGQPAAGGAPYTGATPGAAGTPAAARPVGRARRRFVAIMSGSNARGRWSAPAQISAFAFWGGVVIDLREAEFQGPVVDITAWAIMGGVNVIVGEGVAVEVDGLVLMGGVNHPRTTDVPPGAPLVRVHARGLWGGVNAVVKRPSRRSRNRDRSRDHRIDRRWHELHDRHERRLADWSARYGTPADGRPAGRSEAADGDDGERWVGPLGPLELPQRILDEVADALSRLPGPMGNPVRVPVPPPVPNRRRSNRHEPPAPPATPPEPTDAGVPGDGVRPSGTLTMMVTDIADSTVLAERLGDHRWIGVLAEHNELVRQQISRHGGTEVKAQGDGFLLVFASARRAILAAIDVQRELAAYRDSHPDTPVEVRVGLHTGEIVDVDGDVFGQNVVVAARLANQAAPGEIVVSGLTRDLTVSGGDLSFGPPEEVELKGLSQPWRIHRVTWSHTPA